MAKGSNKPKSISGEMIKFLIEKASNDIGFFAGVDEFASDAEKANALKSIVEAEVQGLFSSRQLYDSKGLKDTDATRKLIEEYCEYIHYGDLKDKVQYKISVEHEQEASREREIDNYVKNIEKELKEAGVAPIDINEIVKRVRASAEKKDAFKEVSNVGADFSAKLKMLNENVEEYARTVYLGHCRNNRIEEMKPEEMKATFENLMETIKEETKYSFGDKREYDEINQQIKALDMVYSKKLYELMTQSKEMMKEIRDFRKSIDNQPPEAHADLFSELREKEAQYKEILENKNKLADEYKAFSEITLTARDCMAKTQKAVEYNTKALNSDNEKDRKQNAENCRVAESARNALIAGKGLSKNANSNHISILKRIDQLVEKSAVLNMSSNQLCGLPEQTVEPEPEKETINLDELKQNGKEALKAKLDKHIEGIVDKIKKNDFLNEKEEKLLMKIATERNIKDKDSKFNGEKVENQKIALGILIQGCLNGTSVGGLHRKEKIKDDQTNVKDIVKEDLKKLMECKDVIDNAGRISKFFNKKYREANRYIEEHYEGKGRKDLDSMIANYKMVDKWLDRYERIGKLEGLESIPKEKDIEKYFSKVEEVQKDEKKIELYFPSLLNKKDQKYGVFTEALNAKKNINSVKLAEDDTKEKVEGRINGIVDKFPAYAENVNAENTTNNENDKDNENDKTKKIEPIELGDTSEMKRKELKEQIQKVTDNAIEMYEAFKESLGKSFEKSPYMNDFNKLDKEIASLKQNASMGFLLKNSLREHLEDTVNSYNELVKLINEVTEKNEQEKATQEAREELNGAEPDSNLNQPTQEDEHTL